MVNEWWRSDEAEIYFMETTDRTDIGVDLRAPQADDAGHAHHAYALVPYARRGDVVFHYQKPHGIVAWSRVAGPPFEDQIVWGARGRVAQKAGVKPYLRAGWRVPLEGPFKLPRTLSLEDLRGYEPAIRGAIEATERDVPGTVYRPFQLSDKQPLRATQHYLTKIPLAVVLEVPELISAADEAGNPGSPGLPEPPTSPEAPSTEESLGQAYVRADEESATTERDPFTIDPSVVDRGVRGHATTQNALAAFLETKGYLGRSPSGREPQYDLAWVVDGRIHVAEVKSLTETNEERQLRLGLGQVLRYRQVLSELGDRKPRAVLAVEREPKDPRWRSLCEELDIILCWPPTFVGL